MTGRGFMEKLPTGKISDSHYVSEEGPDCLLGRGQRHKAVGLGQRAVSDFAVPDRSISFGSSMSRFMLAIVVETSCLMSVS